MNESVTFSDRNEFMQQINIHYIVVLTQNSLWYKACSDVNNSGIVVGKETLCKSRSGGEKRQRIVLMTGLMVLFHSVALVLLCIMTPGGTWPVCF